MTETPYLSIDRERMERNITAMGHRAADLELALRPHVKTHKCIEIAELQMFSGATGLTVATIGEAETFADAGFTDLFIAYPLWLSDEKAARLSALAGRTRLRVGVDSAAGARRLAEGLAGTPVEVLVEIDSGQHRTGVPPREARAIAAAAVAAGLEVVGVFTFPGHGYGRGAARQKAAIDESRTLVGAAAALRHAGVTPRVISGGSTPTAQYADFSVLTEIRPGVYPFGDAQQLELGTCGFDDVALTAVSTVVSRRRNRIVLDAGSKVIGADRPAWASGFGRLLDHPDARITALSEHHAVVDFPSGAALPEVGEVLRVIPNHVCTAVNLADELHLDDGQVWSVAARGANS